MPQILKPCYALVELSAFHCWRASFFGLYAFEPSLISATQGLVMPSYRLAIQRNSNRGIKTECQWKVNLNYTYQLCKSCKCLAWTWALSSSWHLARNQSHHFYSWSRPATFSFLLESKKKGTTHQNYDFIPNDELHARLTLGCDSATDSLGRLISRFVVASNPVLFLDHSLLSLENHTDFSLQRLHFGLTDT